MRVSMRVACFTILLGMLMAMSALAQDRAVTVNVGRVLLIGMAPHFVMEKLGLLEKTSPVPVKVNYVTVTAAPFLIQGLIGDRLDFIVLGPSPAMQTTSKADGSAKIIGSYAYWFAPLLTWRDDVKKLEDIRPGMKIGSPGGFVSNSGVLLLKRWLEMNRPIDELKGMLVSAGQQDLYKAFLSRRIDLWYSTEPSVGLAVTGARVLDSYDGGFGERFPVLVSVGRSKFVREHPEVFRAYIQALDAAFDWTLKNQKEAAEIVGAALKVPPDLVLKAFQEGKYDWGLGQGYSVMEKLASFMKTQRLMQEVNLRELWFEETLDRAVRR